MKVSALITYPARPIQGGRLELAPPKRGLWYAEPKLNGWRALIHTPSATMWNRHGALLTIADRFRPALASLAQLASRWVRHQAKPVVVAPFANPLLFSPEFPPVLSKRSTMPPLPIMLFQFGTRTIPAASVANSSAVSLVGAKLTLIVAADASSGRIPASAQSQQGKPPIDGRMFIVPEDMGRR